MDAFSFLNSSDPELLDELYQTYLENPEKLEQGWKNFFAGFEFAGKNYPASKTNANIVPGEFKVINLINAYRQRGHLFTKTNPVRTRRTYSPNLDIEQFGLAKSDLNKKFSAGHEIGIGEASLAAIIEHLDQTYCHSIGVEYNYIRDTEMHEWLRNKMEGSKNKPKFSTAEKKQILHKLAEAVGFEKFIHKKFPGQKRFSLEGAESLIPALDSVIEFGAQRGTKEFVIGMPHRGRLNVLANILGKNPKEIFSEFEGKEYEDELILGDVKYHLGYTSVRQTNKGEAVKLTLSPNPSHLETVNPVVEGITRARIDQKYNGDSKGICPILIHGDASIAGQGIVYEVLQMSQLNGYKTGGTIHLVVNNQIGFTTNYLDGRTSTYCTDVAKTIQSPILHINGDDVEAVVFAIKLAMEYRDIFKRDVFIDLLCYRKYGHNESDEPRFTQPILYKSIEKHPNPKEIYQEQLLKQQAISIEEAKKIDKTINQELELRLSEAKEIKKAHLSNFLDTTWKHIRRAKKSDFEQSPDTAISYERMQALAQSITTIPNDFKAFRKIVKLFNDRRQMLEGDGKLDWAMGELLAYASLLDEGTRIRLSGQDVERGTFSHRHAVLTEENTARHYIPLQHLGKEQGVFEIYNSPLSEYGVLGFDYGYAMTSPDALTIWEAQFGDFNNGAQIIIDQFISSAEDKWNVMNGLVMLLPHGYEGQGPEHSSARMERFLTLCAENNIQVVNTTTPANFFHLLRRQMKREFRKPLVVFTPKSLLRLPAAVSPFKDFTQGGFQEIIKDKQAQIDKTHTLILCSGKIYYELIAERNKLQRDDVSIVRLEQIYPLPLTQLSELLAEYKNVQKLLWVQEEPANMGAWQFIHQSFRDQDELKPYDLKVIARPPSGSPATGSNKFHFQQQQKIIEKSFSLCDCPRIDIECKMVCIGNQWRSIAKELKLQQ